MISRRKFISTAVVAASSAALLNTKAFAEEGVEEEGYPENIIYTADKPGIWSKKVSLHVPEVKVENDTLIVTNAHPMNEKHYIVRHTVVDEDGKVIGGHTFQPTDKEAVSSYKIPAGSHDKKLYVTSFCNQHDFWVTEFKL